MITQEPSLDGLVSVGGYCHTLYHYRHAHPSLPRMKRWARVFLCQPQFEHKLHYVDAQLGGTIIAGFAHTVVSLF